MTVPAPVVKPVRKRKTGKLFQRKPWLNCSRLFDANHGRMKDDDLLRTRMRKALTLQGALQDALQPTPAARLNSEQAPGPRTHNSGAILGQGGQAGTAPVLELDRRQGAAGTRRVPGGGWANDHGLPLVMDAEERARPGGSRPGSPVQQPILRQPGPREACHHRGQRAARTIDGRQSCPQAGMRLRPPVERGQPAYPGSAHPAGARGKGVSDL